MNKLYNFIIKAFEWIVALFFGISVLHSITENSLYGVLVVTTIFISVMGAWSALMLILNELKEINSKKDL